MMPGAPAPEGEPERRSFFSSETGTRVVSAAILGIVALYAAYAGGRVFAAFWLIAGILAAYEWTAMARVAPMRPLQIVVGLTLALATSAYVAGAVMMAYVVLGAVASGAIMILGKTWRDRLWTLAGLACAVPLVIVPPIVRDAPALGIVALLWMFAVVWSTDIAAYFTGRALGGPKLWPRVSPKKTWSGFLGGLAAGVAAGMLVLAAGEAAGWVSPVGAGFVLVVSALASVVGQLGDLGESALKRHCGVKDSSHLIPGHGGVMDRVDAFWAVCVLTGLLLLAARP